jgi:ABC-type branched-subunit amino acid transport system substrate-binding protein
LLLCSPLAHSQPTPKIGFLLPPDTPHLESLELAATLAATLSVPNGAPPATLVIRGKTGQWGDDGTEAARLAIDDEVNSLITPPDGSASHLVLQVAGRTGLPTLSLCPDTSVVGAGIPWHLQITPDTQHQALTILQYIRNHHPPPWIAIVPEGRAGREISNDLAHAAATIHHPTPDILSFPTNSASRNQLAHNALLSSPTTILVWLNPQPAATVTTLLRKAGFKGTLAGPLHLQSPRFLTAAGPHAESFLTPAWTPPQSVTLNAFSHQYKSKLGLPPDPSALLTADAVLLLRNTLPPNPAPGPLQLPTNLTGLSGPLTFDTSGRRLLPLHLLRLKNGTWTPIQ